MFGLTKKIDGFVLTRDSWLFFWGKLVGVAGLVVSGAIQPGSLGLSEKQAHVVMVACAVVMTLSAQFSRSTLPAKADADRVTLPIKE